MTIIHIYTGGKHREKGVSVNSSMGDCKTYIKIKHQELLKKHSLLKTEFIVDSPHTTMAGQYNNGKLEILHYSAKK